MWMLALAMTPIAPELEALDRAVETCNRAVVSPAFAADGGRRSAVMTEIFREQEAIVLARQENSDRRRALRENRTGGSAAADADRELALATQALEDRQRALNDRRLLETLRAEAIDAKRRFYLAHCANGTNNAKN